jgi:hypothetical protein
MKKTISIVLLLLVTLGMYAQEGINYKALIKDNLGAVLASQTIDVKFTIIADTGPTDVYLETHTGATTDANGIVILTIGDGTPNNGVFTDIDWGSNTHSLKVEIDIEQDGSFVDLGTTQFMAVPYALHAKTAESVTSTCGLSIGDTHQGGIIFYLDASGCHGLIAAPSDQSTGIRWYAGTHGNTQAKGDGIYAGKANTSIIIAAQVAIGDDNANYAARLCNELQIIEGGTTYGDWYLPSKYELNLMYENIGQGNALGLGNVGNFSNSSYWSSTELDNFSAWNQSFFNGVQFNANKAIPNYVRAVRAF